MFSIKVVLRHHRPDRQGLCPIRIRIIHRNGERKEITIKGIKSKVEDWDKNKRCIRNNVKGNLFIEKELKKYEAAALDFNFNNKQASIDDIIKYANAESQDLSQNVVTSKVKVSEYIKTQMESDKNLRYSTRRAIKPSRIRLEKYAPKVTLNEIDGPWLNKFENILKREGYSTWTIHTNLKHIKRAISIAVQNELLNPPNYSAHTMKRGKGAKSHLTEDEIKLLLKYTPNTIQDQFILKAFLFAAFTGGIRFSDCVLLSYENIVHVQRSGSKQYYLKYRMRKTGNEISIPICSLMKK